MAECYTPLEMAEQACRRAGGHEQQEIEISIIREDIRITTLIAESGQARLTGIRSLSFIAVTYSLESRSLESS